MADRTVPRLPKLPELTKLQALLLLGGAFVFGAAIWGACRFDLFVDRTPSAPEGAVFAATIDRTSPDWAAFEAKLPEKARQALAVAGDLGSVTLFAVPGTGADLEWWTVEAMSVVTERTGRKRLRFVQKGTTAVGHLTLDGRMTPFEARITKGLIKARVGKGFRGPSFETDPFAEGRRLLTTLPRQTAFIEKPTGSSWTLPVRLLSGQLQRFQPMADLWNLPGRLELSVSASDTQAAVPFVLYYRPNHGDDLSGPVLETYAQNLLAESNPVGFDIALPDDTTMVELRRDPESVLTVRKGVKEFGERAQLQIPGSPEKMEIFYAEAGEAWLSNDLALIQGTFMGGVNAGKPSGECEVGGHQGFAAFSGQSLQFLPYFSELERVTFTIHDMESGLFTTCGYFTP